LRQRKEQSWLSAADFKTNTGKQHGTNQSKERAPVGEVISTVSLADRISRKFFVSRAGLGAGFDGASYRSISITFAASLVGG
jgi:hypothetical protein